MGSFGEKFRKEREQRGFTLDDVSNVTKISSRMLKAIEEEQFELLPGGVFNKGFIRAYAKHLKLNDEEAVSEYLTALRQAQVDAQNATWPAEHPLQEHVPAERKAKREAPTAALESSATPSHQSVTEKPSPEVVTVAEAPAGTANTFRTGPEPEQFAEAHGPGIEWKIPAIVFAVIILVAVLWNRHSRNARAEATASAHATVFQTLPVAAPANMARSSVAGNSASGAKASSNPEAPHTTKASDSGALPAHEASEKSATGDVTVKKASGETAVGKSAAAPAGFKVQIRAAETSWISVTADGQLITQETLIAPAHTSARATHELVVKAGNAAGVSFLVNGKEIPAQGQEGEVKTYVFDSGGLRSDGQN